MDMHRGHMRRRRVAITVVWLVILIGSASQLIPARAPVEQRHTLMEVMGAFGGRLAALDTEGQYAYLGAGAQVIVLDISSPSSPREIGRTEMLSGVVEGIEVDGSKAYVVYRSGNAGGFAIIDVRDGASPELRAYLALQDRPTGVAFEDTVVYITLETAGLVVVSVSSIRSPNIIGQYSGACNGFQDVDVAGGYAYLACDAGLLVVSVQNGSEPLLTGAFPTPGHAGALAVAERIAYVADQYGLHAVSVSNPASPVYLGSFDVPLAPKDVEVAGRFAYVATFIDYLRHDSDVGLHIVDVADPENPREIGFVRGATPPGAIEAVRVSNGFAFLAKDGEGAQVLSLTQTAHPEAVGFYASPGETFDHVAVSGSRAFLAGMHLWAVNLQEPSRPSETSRVYGWGGREVHAEGQYVYVASGGAGLVLYSVDTRGSLRRVSQLRPGSGSITNVYVDGEYAFVIDGSPGVHIVSVLDKTAPHEVGFIPTLHGQTETTPSDVYAVGDTAYVVDSFGLHIVSIESRQNPREVAFLPLASGGKHLQVEGRHAYALGSSEMYIVSVEDVAAPRLIAAFPAPETTSFSVADDVLCLAQDDALIAMDVSAPSAPRQSGRFVAPDTIGDVHLDDGLAFVTCGQAGLLVLDIDQTVLPTPTASPASTPTPTATPQVAWIDWAKPNSPLFAAPAGYAVDLAYGNITTPAAFTSTLVGPAVFTDGSQMHTDTIRMSSGLYELILHPEDGSAAGDTFELDVALSDLTLSCSGVVPWQFYLPLTLME